MSEQPTGLVRIVIEGVTAGTGFLVDDDGLIASCTHVLGAEGTQDAVHVLFRFGPPDVAVELREARVVVALTRPAEAEDVAFVQLVDPVPDGVAAFVPGSSHGALGGTYRTFGFPETKPVEGMAGEVRVTGRTSEGGFDVLQLRSNEVSRGFSGAPVWDEHGAVVGMVMSVVRPDSLGRQGEVSFVRPIEQLIAVCPTLRPQLVSPYRGLEVFDEEHADDYFGRERAGRQLLNKLTAHNFVAVVGVSGSGKSSLVRAGLKKSLAQFPVPGLTECARCVMVPGSAPMLDLALALRELFGVAPVTRAFGLSAAALGDPEASLRETGDKLGRVEPDAAARAIRGLAPGGLLVVVDQFERLFTETRDVAVRRHFLDGLLAMASDDVKVLITLRADFYGLALAHPGFDALLGDGQLTLSPMTDDELVQAIEEPARRRRRRLEPGLAQRLIADVKGRPGDLPLLEFALAELWERDGESGVLRLATYDGELGYQGSDGRAYPGVQGAIAKRAEQIWTGLEPDERAAARRVFLSVIGAAFTSAETSALEVSSSRRAWLIELNDAERAVAEKLASARLLTTGRDPYGNQATIEVAHEALIRAWPLLGQWAGSFRPFVRWRDGDLAPLWQRWITHDHDPQLLLPFGMLDEARRWNEEYADELSPAHVEYIQASVEAFEAHTARREAELVRTTRLNRRLRALVVGLGAFFVVSALATILAVRQTDRARDEARVGASRLLSNEAEGRGPSDPTLSVLLSLAASNSADTPEARRSLQNQIVRQRNVQRILTGDPGPVGVVAYSPDGRMLAAAGASGVSVWDRRGRTAPVRLRPPSGTVRAVSFGRGGRVLAAGGDGGVVVWDMTPAARPRLRGRWRDRAGTLAMSPDGRRIAFAGTDATLIVQDVVGEHRQTIRIPGAHRIDAIAITPDSRRAVTVGDSGWSVWNLASGAQVRRVRGYFSGSSKTALALSADGRRLATDTGLEVALWDMADGTKVDELSSARAGFPLAFRPDGEALAVTVTEGLSITKILTYPVSARGFEKNDGVPSPGSLPQKLLVGQRREVSSLAYDPGGGTLASSSTDGTVTLWDAAGRDTIRDDKLSTIDTVAFSWRADVLAVGGSPQQREDGTGALAFVDVARRRTLSHSRCARFAASRPHTTMWAISAADCGGGLAVVDPSRADGKRLVTLLRPTSKDRSRMLSEGVRFSPDGRQLAEHGRPYRPSRLGEGKGTLTDKEVVLWDPDTPGAPLARLEVAPPETYFSNAAAGSFAFSPDGRTLAIGRSYDRTATDVGDDAKILLWDTRRRKTTATIKIGTFVSSVAFDPRGEMLAVGTEDRVELWRLSDRSRVAVIGGIRGTAQQLAFTPDGEKLAVADSDGVLLVSVKPATSAGVRLHGNAGSDPGLGVLGSFAISPDGKALAVADGSDAVVMWDLEAQTWRRDLCRLVDRDFTRSERVQFLPPGQRAEPTCPGG